jgi:peroxiredoxin
MHLRILAPVLTLSILTAMARADDAASTARLGKKIANVTLIDAASKPVALHDLKDRKAIAIVFLSFECPMSTSYAQALADLAKTYGERGVSVWGVVAEETPLAKHAKEFDIPFPLLLDAKHALADALKAEVTPEAFVLDGDFVLRYRGRIDDQYAARLKRKERLTREDVRVALDEILAGKEVSEPATKAVGCTLPHRRPASAATGKVTFYKDVQPILQQHCLQCHRPGDVAPFALTSYKKAVTWAADIKEYTQSRKMPPWKPTSDFPLHGERRLSDAELATLAAWVDGGTPAGDPKEGAAPRRFTEGWHLGEPDLVLTMPEEFTLAPTGPDVYRCFVLPTKLGEDKYVTAVEVRPGNRRVVHHAVIVYDSDGRARKLEEKEKERAKKMELRDRGPGYQVPLALSFLPGFLPEGGLGGWAPGMVPRHLPERTGYLLPKGADVVLQLHYHRTGRVEKDRTTMGVYFAKKRENRRLRDVTIPGQFLYIPAGEERFKVDGTMWIRQDCEIHNIMPHMHLLGRTIKMTMTPPEGKPQTLVDIRDWDFDWQELYFPQKSIAVKSGTRFDIEATFDNSMKNARNPFSPPRNVYPGMQTTNEMCVGFLCVTSDKPGPVRFDVQPRIPGLKWRPNWGIPGIGF